MKKNPIKKILHNAEIRNKINSQHRKHFINDKYKLVNRIILEPLDFHVKRHSPKQYAIIIPDNILTKLSINNKSLHKNLRLILVNTDKLQNNKTNNEVENNE